MKVLNEIVFLVKMPDDLVRIYLFKATIRNSNSKFVKICVEFV